MLLLGVHLCGISFGCRRGCVRQYVQLDAIQDGLLQYRHIAARGQHSRQGPRLGDDGREMGNDCAQDRVYAIVANDHMTMTALFNIAGNDWPLWIIEHKTCFCGRCLYIGLRVEYRHDKGMLLQVLWCSLQTAKRTYMKIPHTCNYRNSFNVDILNHNCNCYRLHTGAFYFR